MKVVTFKIEDNLLEELDRYVNEKGTVRSAVIRNAIADYLKRNYRVIVTKRLRIYY